MKVFRISDTLDHLTEAAVEESSTNYVERGALLLVVRSGILQRTIPVAINDVRVTLNQDMKALSFPAEGMAEFFAFLVRGHASALRQQWLKEGATVESIEHELLANALVPIVPEHERRSIVEFLDYETAKIDALIEKQQQLIALLKEKRQAVISHAVTKGLNPDAPMRNSGIEWLGEVPAHWTVGRYKFCTTRVVVGIAEAATHAYADEGVPIIRSTNIKDDHLSQIGLLYIKPEFAEQNFSKYLYANDIVTVRTGYPGISAIVPQILNRSQCFTNLIATPKSDCDPRFLCEFLNSHLGRTYFDLLGWGSAQKNISVPILQNIPIVYPERIEQVQIADYVMKQRGKFAPLIANAQEMVNVLQERRTALISAAVTGKIDVRSWTAPEIKSEAEVA